MNKDDMEGLHQHSAAWATAMVPEKDPILMSASHLSFKTKVPVWWPKQCWMAQVQPTA